MNRCKECHKPFWPYAPLADDGAVEGFCRCEQRRRAEAPTFAAIPWWAIVPLSLCAALLVAELTGGPGVTVPSGGPGMTVPDGDKQPRVER